MVVSSKLHAPDTLFWGESPQHPLDRMSGSQSWSGSSGKMPLPGIEPQLSST